MHENNRLKMGAVRSLRENGYGKPEFCCVCGKNLKRPSVTTQKQYEVKNKIIHILVSVKFIFKLWLVLLSPTQPYIP